MPILKFGANSQVSGKYAIVVLSAIIYPRDFSEYFIQRTQWCGEFQLEYRKLQQVRCRSVPSVKKAPIQYLQTRGK